MCVYGHFLDWRLASCSQPLSKNRHGLMPIPVLFSLQRTVQPNQIAEHELRHATYLFMASILSPSLSLATSQLASREELIHLVANTHLI